MAGLFISRAGVPAFHPKYVPRQSASNKEQKERGMPIFKSHNVTGIPVANDRGLSNSFGELALPTCLDMYVCMYVLYSTTFVCMYVHT